jgi:hypothetical protein
LPILEKGREERKEKKKRKIRKEYLQ